MSKKTSYLLGMLLTIVIGTFLYCYLCDDCYCGSIWNANEISEDNIVDTPATNIKKASFNPFFITSDGDDLGIKSNDNFNFNFSSFSPQMPIATSVNEALAKLKAYMSAHPGKLIDVTGYYSTDETNNSAFPNLGLARANSVKNYLSLKGISSKYINTFGMLNNELAADSNNILNGPVSFKMSMSDASASEDEMEVLRDNIKANPLVLYFNTGQTTINLSPEQRQKIANISRYLDKVDGASCKVVGHTDNTGDSANNIVLGQNRAEFGKAYLVSNGISESKITATSKGQTEPIADNATETGRAKNRRTVITIN